MSSSPENPSVLFHFGGLFLGLAGSAFLWGANSALVGSYAQRSELSVREQGPIRTLLFSLWILDTGHQALFTHFAYKMLIPTRSTVPLLSTCVPNSIWVLLLVGGLITCLVKSFLVSRIWRCKHFVLPFILNHQI